MHPSAMNDSIMEQGEEYEIVWEQEIGESQKVNNPSEAPKIDFQSLTRTTQKMKTANPQPVWRKVLKFAKAPYKVHTDRQSAFGPQAQDYRESMKKSA